MVRARARVIGLTGVGGDLVVDGAIGDYVSLLPLTEESRA